MADEQDSKKKVVGIRTFADDMERARSMKNTAAPEKTEPKKSPTSNPVPPPSKPNEDAGPRVTQPSKDASTEKAVPAPPPASIPTPPRPSAPPKPQQHNAGTKVQTDASSENAGVVFEEPTVIPPFHSIRASSPSDTMYTSEESMHIPDKESLKRETIHTDETAQFEPQRKVTIDPKTIDVDEFAEMMPSIHEANALFDAEEAMQGGADGTIIQDKKHSEFKLFSAVGKAFGKWFGKKREEIEDSRNPKHTVVKASRRKDVITAAGQETHYAPPDDYKTVAERLRSVERINPKNEITVKDETAAKPSWTYTKEDTGVSENQSAINSLEAAVNPQVPVQTSEVAHEEEHTYKTSDVPVQERVREAASQPTPPPLTQAQVPIEQKPVTTPRPPTLETVVPSTPVVEENRAPEPVAETTDVLNEPVTVIPEADTPQPDIAQNVATGEELDDSTPHLNQPPVPTERLNKLGQPKVAREPSGTPFLTMTAVIIAASVLGVATSVWWFTRNVSESTDSIVTEPAADLVTSNSRSTIAVSEDVRATLAELRNTIQNSQGTISTFTPTIDGAYAEPDEVLARLNVAFPRDAARSVTRLTFGGYSGSEPFIVMKFNSFDTVFAGMLAWERDIVTDLAPLFPNKTVATVIDSRVNNRDVRVFIGSGGEDVLVYGFTDKNTLLITTTRSLYTTIAEEVH